MIVVDCSVVLDLILRPSSLSVPPPDAAWHAPSTLDTELVSAVRGLWLGAKVSRGSANAALDAYTDLGIRSWAVDSALRRRMLALASNVSAHDAAYVALAEGLDLELVTRDRRLARAAAGLVPVRVI